MAETSGISWTDSTFNPWIGCTKVSTGPQGLCEHCYAERDNNFRKWVPGWGPGVPRRRTKTWDQPRKWESHWETFKQVHGRYRRVFCASLADVFDNEVPDEWRVDLWQLLRDTPHLNWILLTKRIGNAAKMLPSDWPFPNAGLMASIGTQAEWDRDSDKLFDTPAFWRGISAEPLFDFITMGERQPDWVITGGESGPDHRPLHMAHVRHLRDQCAVRSIAFHHKQNGGKRGKDGGCLVDGVEHKQFPVVLGGW
jgi:protein gp37